MARRRRAVEVVDEGPWVEWRARALWRFGQRMATDPPLGALSGGLTKAELGDGLDADPAAVLAEVEA